jgi:2,3-bisphosphoglycerate-independent phosphoglycerate mutase
MTELGPEVLIVTGDHSTPSRLRSHSWHPVPTLLASPNCRPDRCVAFGERDCLQGGLGIFPAKHLMLLAMGHALRLGKFGA